MTASLGARFKFSRDGDSLLPVYLVELDGKAIGWVSNVGDGWVANCKPDGCWCHMDFWDTRREAAEYLNDSKETEER